MPAPQPTPIRPARIRRPWPGSPRLPATLQRPSLVVLGLYALSRLWSTGLLLAWFGLAKTHDLRLGNAGRHASFTGFLNSWDGAFYLDIARHGYPARLPLDAAGHVIGGSWAFLPVFPALVRALSAVTVLPIDASAVIVATLAGGASAFALHRLVSLRVDARAALWATALYCFGPLAFLLETGYAEGLGLFFAWAGIAALIRHRYALVTAFGIAAAFTRPGIALALAVAVAVQLVLRGRPTDRIRPTVRSPASLVAAAVAGAAVAAAGLAWPVIAGAVTGVPDAYVQTELAWWASSVGRHPFVPLTPWFRMGVAYLGWLGPIVVVLALALGVGFFVRRSLRRLGPEIVTSAAAYCLYLFAVFLPQQSLFRLVLLPLAPLGADPWLTSSAIRRRAALMACLVLQPVAVVVLWSVSFP